MTTAGHGTRDDIVAFLCEELRSEREARAELQEQLWALSRSADAAATSPTPVSTHHLQGLLQSTADQYPQQDLHQHQYTYRHSHEAAHPMQLASSAQPGSRAHPTSTAPAQFQWHGTDGVQLQQLHQQQQQQQQQQQPLQHTSQRFQHNQHLPTSHTPAPSPAQTVQTPSVHNARQHYPAANSTSSAAAGYRRAAHISSSWSDVSSSCASLPAADPSAASILSPLLPFYKTSSSLQQPTHCQHSISAGTHHPAAAVSADPSAATPAAAAAAAAAAGCAPVVPPLHVMAQGLAAEARATVGGGSHSGYSAVTGAASSAHYMLPPLPAATARAASAAETTAAQSAPYQAAAGYPTLTVPAIALPDHISRAPPLPPQAAPPPAAAAAAAVQPSAFTALSQSCSSEAPLQLLFDAAAARQRNSQQLLAESTLSSSDGEDDADFLNEGQAASRAAATTMTEMTAPAAAAAAAGPTAGTWVELTPPPALRAYRIRPVSLSDRYTAAAGLEELCLRSTNQASAALPQAARLSDKYSAAAGAQGLLLGGAQQASASATAAAAAMSMPASLSDRSTTNHHAAGSSLPTAAAAAAEAATSAVAPHPSHNSIRAASHAVTVLPRTAAVPAGGLGADCAGCAALSEALLEAEFLRELSTAQLTVVQEERHLLAQQNRSLVQLLADSSMAQQNYPGG